MTALIELTDANILHNWDFRNPVNQRGVSGAITTVGYFLDRWRVALVGASGVTVYNGYIRMSPTSKIEQRIEGTALIGQQITITYKTPAGYYHKGTVTVPSTGSVFASVNDTHLSAEVGAGFLAISLYTTSGKTIDIESVKAEIGPNSTLAFDPPANYGEELRKCQRHFVQFSRMDIYGGAYGEKLFRGS